MPGPTIGWDPLVVLDQAIDTGSPTGRLLFHMLAAIGISGALITP